MAFLPSGQHDDRRRRLLTEESAAGAASKERTGRAAARQTSQPKRYSEAARMDRQARITDLIPQRFVSLLLVFLAGAVVIAALEALYAWMPDLAAHTSDGRIAAFDLDGEGSLAACFSSATLALAGFVSLIVYSIRKHKTDDYHGRYRVWLWGAVCWFVMAIDESGSLHEGFKEAMTRFTGQRVYGDGSVWWVAAYGLLLGGVSLRLLMDMRASLAAAAALIATGLCWAGAVVTQLEFLLPQSGARGVMLEEGLEMAGNLFLVLSIALYARHVIRDAQGLIPAPARAAAGDQKAPQRKKPEPPAAPAPPTKRSDLASPPRVTLTPTSTSATSTRSTAYEDDDYDDDYEDRGSRRDRVRHRLDDAEGLNDNRKLSKAERKALRRQKEQQRRGE